jgi:hypothetical protein
MSDTNQSSGVETSARPIEGAVILQAVAEAAPIATLPVPTTVMPALAATASPPPASSAPPAPSSLPAPRGSEDQLPTTRFPSLPAVFPEALERALNADANAPSVPAAMPSARVAVSDSRDRKTAPRVLSRSSWRTLLTNAKRVARAVPARVTAAGRQAWSQRRVGIACGVLGMLMILGSLGFGVYGVAAARFDKTEQVSLAVAIVLARAAIAIATMGVGYAMIRVAERLSFPAAGLRLAPPPALRPRSDR